MIDPFELAGNETILRSHCGKQMVRTPWNSYKRGMLSSGKNGTKFGAFPAFRQLSSEQVKPYGNPGQ
jgi:hypothetical protein